MKKIYPSAFIYECSIEPLLKKIKKRAAQYISQYDLYPALDVCSGTGAQCHMISMNNPHVIGLDFDQKMIQYSSVKYPHVSFISADATHVPLKNKHFKGIVLSFSLHDKSPEMRIKIIEESKRLLEPEGKILLIDFENPWNKGSKLGSFFVYLIERAAGKEHFWNGRQFLKQGGLQVFLEQNELIEIERHNVELASSAIVLAQFD